jgi:hypothetical protein
MKETRISRQEFWTRVLKRLPEAELAGHGLCRCLSAVAREYYEEVFGDYWVKAGYWALVTRESQRLQALKPHSNTMGGWYWWDITPAGYRQRRAVVRRLIRENIRPVEKAYPPMTDRCPHCSFQPTTLSDYCDLHRPPTMVSIEICLCAAIRLTDGYIIRGHRHNDCFRTLSGMTLPSDVRVAQQGFLTTGNRFVDRRVGLQLQLAAGIPSARGGYHSQLYSEDLY